MKRIHTCLLALLTLVFAGCASVSVPDIENRLRTLSFAPERYSVRANDSLESIAFRYRMSVAQLQAMNPSLSQGLRPGMWLTVSPSSGQTQIASRSQRLDDPSSRRHAPATYGNRQQPAGSLPEERVAVAMPVQPRHHVEGRPLGSQTAGSQAPAGQLREGQLTEGQLREGQRVGTPGIVTETRASSRSTPGLITDSRASSGAADSWPREEIIADTLDAEDWVDGRSDEALLSERSTVNDQQLAMVTPGARPVPGPVPGPAAGAQAVFEGRWSWPTDGQIARGFQPDRVGGQGVDIAGVPGQDVRAAMDGTVVYSGRDLSGVGNLIILRHPDNLLSTYSHTQNLYVAEDDVVRAGDPIASLGANENSESVLGFEIRRDGNPLNPLDFLPVR